MKGVLVAVFIAAIVVSLINAVAPDQPGCANDGGARCDGGNSQYGLISSPVFWILFALLNPDGYDGFIHEVTREKTLSTETLASLDLATKIQIFDGIKHCREVGANADDTGRFDKAAFNNCRDELAAPYGLVRDDLNWISDEAHRGRLTNPPEGVARLDETTKKQIFEEMRHCESEIHEETSGYIDDYYKTLLNRCWSDVAADHGVDRADLDWIGREG